MSRGWLGWLVLAAVVAGAFAVGVSRSDGPRTQQDRIDAIARTIKCPTCRSESVYESKAAAAVNIRSEIARQVAAGRTDDEVRAYLADRFGEEILLVPRASGVSALVWALPVAALVLAAGGLAWAFQRWRTQAALTPQATDDDEALVAAALREEQS